MRSPSTLKSARKTLPPSSWRMTTPSRATSNCTRTPVRPPSWNQTARHAVHALHRTSGLHASHHVPVRERPAARGSGRLDVHFNLESPTSWMIKSGPSQILGLGRLQGDGNVDLSPPL